MNIPDYISPIVGYRVWQWDAVGLKSLNNERWLPGQVLEAECKVYRLIFGPDAPHKPCDCGIYAAKNLEHLFAIGYMNRGDIHGEVYLWGKIFDHSLGYRSEYAYPKRLVLPPDKVPVTFCEVESRLESLIAYGVDIFIAAPKTEVLQDIPLWTKASGYNQAGFDWLTERRRHWRLYCEQERTLKVGDRVAILNHGICSVDRLDGDRVYVRIWFKRLLDIPRDGVVWNRQNWQWESDGTDCRVIVL